MKWYILCHLLQCFAKNYILAKKLSKIDEQLRRKIGPFI